MGISFSFRQTVQMVIMLFIDKADLEIKPDSVF